MKTYDALGRAKTVGRKAVIAMSVVLAVVTIAAAARGIFIIGAWLYGDAGGALLAVVVLAVALALGFSEDK